MSGPFNIGSIFQKAPAPAANPNTGNAGNAGTGNPAGTGGTPANSGMNVQNPNAGVGTAQNLNGGTGDGSQPNSGMDSFVDIFKVDPNKKVAGNPLAEPLFNMDPAKLAEHVNKMDFSRGLNAETLQKIFSGDPAQAGPALQNALNGVARAVMMTAMQVNSTIMQNAFNTNNNRFDSVLSGRFRDFQIRNTPASNKALQHPAAQPVLAAMKEQIARQFPDKQPHEVAKMAEDYFLEMGKAINGVGEGTTTTTTTGGGNKNTGAEDWTRFLESSPAPTQ